MRNPGREAVAATRREIMAKISHWLRRKYGIAARRFRNVEFEPGAEIIVVEMDSSTPQDYVVGKITAAKDGLLRYKVGKNKFSVGYDYILNMGTPGRSFYFLKPE